MFEEKYQITGGYVYTDVLSARSDRVCFMGLRPALCC
jgi:hypothetical protein